MEPYHQLTREQRYQISALMNTGHSQAQTARVIGVHPATVGRELQRNGGDEAYQPQLAQRQALERRRRPRGVRIGAPLWVKVERLLRQDWSPEQITGRLKREGAPAISPEWIYQHILRDKRSGGSLYRHLRFQKKYHKRYGHYDRRGKLLGARSIDERPQVVEQRTRLGDWEVDTMSGRGRRGGLLTLTERKSRFSLLGRLSKRNPEQVESQLCRLLRPLRETLHTLTSDRGGEFQAHQRIEQRLGLTYYFAHPHAAWERGTNENTNGLLRQSFPKQRNLLTVSAAEVRRAQRRLNERPRKCLAFQTPFEVFFQLSVALVT